jgi:hypothetical protein
MRCTACGSSQRTHDAVGDLKAEEARIGLVLKARRPGGKKPHLELKQGPSYSHSRDKSVEHQRVINRATDQYAELVRDYETGEVVHRTNEPLSKHLGHGSAKWARKAPDT